MAKDLNYLLNLSGIMPREKWYAHLASLNYKIVRIEELIHTQKEIVARELDDKCLDMAVDVLTSLQETERLLLTRRRTLLQALRKYPLPPRTEVELACVEKHGEFGGYGLLKGERSVCNECGSDHCLCESELES